MSFRSLCAVVALLIPAALDAAAPPTPIDPGRVKALLQDLDDDDFHVRQRADEALRALAQDVRPLLEAERERTRSPEVRWRLGRILDDLKLDRRVEALVQQLGESDRQARRHAEWALRQAGGAVVPLLQELKPGLTAAVRKRVEKIITELSAAH